MRASILFLSLLTLCSSVYAQNAKPEKPMSDGKKKQLADALMEQGSYYNAVDLYEELYESKKQIGVAWNIAQGYWAVRDYPNAGIWYSRVWSESPGAYPEAQYYHALCLKMDGKYAEAKKEFDGFRKSTKMKGPEASRFKRLAKNESKGCDLAQLIMGEPIDMDIAPMGPRINAPYTEFSPIPLGEDEFLYASLRTDSVVTMGPNKKTELRSQFYTSTRKGGVWGEGQLYDDVFNGIDGHVGNGTFSPDKERFYFTVCNPDEDVSKMICDIYMSTLDRGKWSKPKRLGEVNEAGFSSTQPAVVKFRKKEILYFSSDRSGGRGGRDLWYSVITGNGSKHARPRNCGPRLNTPGDEMSPFWDAKNEVMYFSSNGQINIGGMDIFKASGYERTWKDILNAGYPLNSNVDDFYYSTGEEGARGFLVSNRKGAISLKNEYCCDDIFSFEYIYPPEFTIMGMVYEKGAATKTPIADAFVQLKGSEGNHKDSTVSTLDVKYDFYVGSQFDLFKLGAAKAGYVEDKATVSTKGLTETDTLYVDLYLEPIDTTRFIAVKDIYYELDKATLRPESKEGLDSLYNVMLTYPTARFEVSSHTDSRGGFDYNIDLSQRRAQSVIDYLVNQKGVDLERLVAKGYGEGKLLNDCADGVRCSEEEHQINRRTEFRLLGTMPGVIVTYDKGTLDAMRALERERGSINSRIKELMQLDDVDALEEQIGADKEEERNTGQAPAEEVEEVVAEVVTEVVEEAAPVKITKTNAELDNSLSRKGSFFMGAARVNGYKEVTFTYISSRPVVFVSATLFSELYKDGTIEDKDFKNSKPTKLPDGTSIPGDIFDLESLQVGDKTFYNVEAKLNTRMKEELVFGAKFVSTNRCKIDTKKNRITCK